MLVNGDKYVQNVTGNESILCEDYNGLWYMKTPLLKGFAKTLSVDAKTMEEDIKLHYTKSE